MTEYIHFCLNINYFAITVMRTTFLGIIVMIISPQYEKMLLNEDRLLQNTCERIISKSAFFGNSCYGKPFGLMLVDVEVW